MPLSPSQLGIAALVLVVIAGLILVTLRRRRAKAAQAQQATIAAAAADAAPSAPSRRRQLKSFVDTEWDTTPEPLPEAIRTPEPEPEPEPFAEVVQPIDPEYPAETAAPPPPPNEDETPPLDYDQAVLRRLEEAFEALQAGTLSLAAYRERILAEEAMVDRRVAMLEDDGDSDELQAALVAQESVRWCLDWAEEQGQDPSD